MLNANCMSAKEIDWIAVCSWSARRCLKADLCYHCSQPRIYDNDDVFAFFVILANKEVAVV